MPRKQEEKLRQIAMTMAKKGKLKKKKGDSLDESVSRFVWGTMRNQGTWKNKKTK